MSRTFSIGSASEIIVVDDLPNPLLPDREGRSKVAILFQPTVRHVVQSIVDRLRSFAVTLIQIDDRDDAKTWQSVAAVYDQLATDNLGRHDTILGVGGGAATDLAGFVAATWLRGIESVLVPTTLLGAVDAAIGGKTGINHAGKNLVGAFWFPTRVVVSLDILSELPRHLVIEGTAEIVKTGFIADPGILDAYQRHGLDAPMSEVVPAAIAVKTSVVSEDPTERGRRAILNFGHTIGHGVETVTGMSHGQAVSVGMVAAAAVSERRHGFPAGDVSALLTSLELPVGVSGVSKRLILDRVAMDKKRSVSGLRMVLLRAVADPVVDLVDDEDLEAGLSAIGAD